MKISTTQVRLDRKLSPEQLLRLAKLFAGIFVIRCSFCDQQVRPICRQQQLPLEPSLIGGYLHIPKHKWIVTKPQSNPAGGGHLSKNNFFGDDIRKFLHIAIIGHFWIKIRK